MALRAVSHIAIGCRDLEGMLPFYRDLLGMRLVVERDEQFKDPASDPPMTRTRRAAYLRWEDGPDTQFVVLSTSTGGDAAGLFELGVNHVAFWVDDLDPYLERVGAVGGRVLAPPVESGGPSYAEPEGSRVRTVYLIDPEGNAVQLDQRLSSSWG